jgi:hypothetical protein
MRIRDGKNSDPGWKTFVSGIRSGINIPDTQHWSWSKYRDSYNIEYQEHGKEQIRTIRLFADVGISSISPSPSKAIPR